MEKMDFSKFGYGKVADHIEELKDIVGPENVMTAMHDRAMRAASCAPFPMQRWEDHIPDVVVLPGSTEEVSEVMKLANKYKLPVVPRGAGCGLADGAFPLNKGICLDMKRMNEILEVDDINRTVTVQPGVNMQELNKVLDKVGMYYPDDPASYGTAVIGGRIGTNGWSVGGAGSGHPANLVCSMEVVLPTGEVVWLGKGGSRKCRNSSAGYRMLELFFGHQGTLGVVTEAVLDCCPKPEVEFPSYYGFASYEEAYNALYQIGISGVKCAVNYIMFDDEKIDFLRRDDEAFIPLPESVKCVVMATFAGTEGEVLAARKKILGIMLLVLSIYFLFFKGKIKLPSDPQYGFLAGLIGGITNGLFGAGGPPVVIYLLGATASHAIYLATIQGYFAFNNIYATIVRFLSGQLTPEVLTGLWGAIPAMVLGIFVGDRLAPHLPDKTILKGIYILMALSGLNMLR